jgi:N-acetyl-gamma-glutamylphosphate reductase
MIRAAIVGGAGYTGGEVLRLLAGHPEIDVVQVTSERLAGKPVASVHPPLRGRTELRFTARDSLAEVDVVFAAMHHGESSGSIAQLRACAPVVIDLGADFRLRDAQDYPQWYGWDHPAPHLLVGAVYGLAEMHRAEIAGASLIASGGCLATASIIGLAPLACCWTRRSLSLSRRKWAHPRGELNPATRRITRIAAARSDRTRPQGTGIPPRSSRNSISGTQVAWRSRRQP